MLEEHLREAKEYFLVFDKPKLNMRQFREGIQPLSNLLGV